MKAVKVPVHIPLSGETMEFDDGGSVGWDAVATDAHNLLGNWVSSKMKLGELRSIGHNLADSFASRIGLLVGVYGMDVFLSREGRRYAAFARAAGIDTQ